VAFDVNKLTPEQIQKSMACKSLDEFQAYVKSEGFDLDEAEAQAILASDRMVSDREEYDIKLVQGDMADPLPFEDGSFDMVVNPVSNHYVEDVDDGEKLGEYNIPTSILTRAVKRCIPA